jgi:hypothetical protein
MRTDTNIKLLKKSRAIYLSVRFSSALLEYNKHSALFYSYTSSYYCSRYLVVDGNNILKTKYCKNRWCFTCNRIRTAQLINGYQPQLDKIQDKYFVTLTAPTIAGNFLKARIKEFEEQWRKITNLYNQTKPFETFKGIRKMECTLRDNDLYHYHYHVIIEGKAQAEWLLNQWLKRFPSAKRQAQDIRAADNGSSMELFKYFTKLISKDTSMFADTHRTINAFKRLDLVFNALKGKRVFQSFGGLKAVSEAISDELMKDLERPSDKQGKFWKWVEKDWVSEYGELLTGYKPAESIEQLLKHCPPATYDLEKMS